MIEKNTSTRFIQLAEVGGEVQVDAWMLGQPGPDLGMGMGAGAVQHHMQLRPPRRGLGHQLKEREELTVAHGR